MAVVRLAAPLRSRFIGIVLLAAVVATAAVYGLRVSGRVAGIALDVSIAAQVAFAYLCRPFEFPDSARLSWKLALPLVAQGLVAAFALPLEAFIVVVCGSALILRLAAALLYHWPGGVTAWSVPAVGLAVETFTLFYMQKGASPIG